MNNKTRKYLEILKIELEDLIEDLEFSEKVTAKRHEDHEITEYVFLENLSLLKKEVLGVEKLKKMVEGLEGRYTATAELREEIENYFIREIKSTGLPEVVFLLVSRKLDKIDKYIDLQDGC